MTHHAVLWLAGRAVSDRAAGAASFSNCRWHVTSCWLRCNPRARDPRSRRILVERLRARRKLNPAMPAAVVNGNLRRRKVGIRESTNRDAHRFASALLAVKHGCPTDRAEPEDEPGTLVTVPNVFGGGTEDSVRGGKTGQRCKDATGPLLAREAVAKPDTAWLAFDLYAQLPAGTRGCSRRHSGVSPVQIHTGLPET